jgi:hypothetical protein
MDLGWKLLRTPIPTFIGTFLYASVVIYSNSCRFACICLGHDQWHNTIAFSDWTEPITGVPYRHSYTQSQNRTVLAAVPHKSADRSAAMLYTQTDTHQSRQEQTEFVSLEFFIIKLRNNRNCFNTTEGRITKLTRQSSEKFWREPVDF